MPTTLEAIELLQKAGIPFAPGKAANAGGVAVSGLEMAQDSIRMRWSREDVDTKLQAIMKSIHDLCVHYSPAGENIDYIQGANTAAFVRVADAMLEQGLV